MVLTNLKHHLEWYLIAIREMLKAVEAWTDLGFGEFELCYLRDKKKREVDFLVVFQVVMNEPFSGRDCFETTTPSVVSAKTFLSQLV